MYTEDGFTEEQLQNAEVLLTGHTYVYCSYCSRIITATSPKTRKARAHRLDLSPGYRGYHAISWEKDDPRHYEAYVQINTECPGNYEPGEVVEGEIYQSPIDTTKVFRIQ